MRYIGFLGAVAAALVWGSVAQANVPPQITKPIDDSQRVVLHGNTRPEANARNDRGALPDNAPITNVELLLRRSPASEKAFERLIADLHNPHSPSFHHWLTAAEMGDEFGANTRDIGRIENWLEAQGFQVIGVTPDRTVIEFSGTAGDIRDAFHTEIHALDVKGETHFANMSDPQIPTALAPAVVGVVSLHNFRPHPMYKTAIHMRGTTPDSYSAACFPVNPATINTTPTSYTDECLLVTPADLATIYNMNPLFQNGITGKGQTVVVVEDTDVFKRADWNLFRAVTGLSIYKDATFTEIHPSGSLTCTDPGVNGDEGEAILDAEYASSSAPDAAIDLASCTDGSTNATFGGLVAIQNLTGETGHPNIVSMSYGECEAENGATNNAAFNTAFQNATAAGISVYVSAGDESATSCDANRSDATHGIGISGFASSQYDIAVGGTDYGDTGIPLSGTNESSTFWQTYWNSTNGTGFGSALSYIPEVPWNDSCAMELMSQFYTGSTLTYGTTGFCNSTFGKEEFLSTGSGSGGPSGCATGAPTVTGVVGGTCAGYAKPTYQSSYIGSMAGLVNDSVRDIPDVSLFAANGVWGHYYPFCDSDPSDSPSGSGFPSGCYTSNPGNWAGAGGTSFSSPIWAGIQALINQETGEAWGNSDTQYYALAAAEYGASGNSNCNSSLGNGIASTCVFNDITQGDFNVNCRADTGRGGDGNKHNCYLPSSTNGVSTTDLTNSTYSRMYPATVGWDFTTGIGTPNVNNLVNNFTSGISAPNAKNLVNHFQ
jgi:subtilase family serine protease